MHHMKTASVRDLRYNFKKIERSLQAGEEIEVTKRRKVIARLVPVTEPCRKIEWPDFEGRLRKIWGDKILEPSNAELIAQDRDRF